jgi:hypothetical protein
MPYGRNKQKDAYVKRNPGKNLRKVEAKTREHSTARRTRRDESGPTQPQGVTAKMADRQSAKTFQVGRDAKTGRFIPVKEAKRRTKTALVETINKKK